VAFSIGEHIIVTAVLLNSERTIFTVCIVALTRALIRKLFNAKAFTGVNEIKIRPCYGSMNQCC
jgi:hypothetical protein